MEKNANYALVGISTIVILAAAAVFVIWLAKLQFSQENSLYDIVFQGPVRGLNQGGEVHFNGIKVGEVRTIALDRTNPSRVIARVRVSADVPIRVDSYATLEPQGITGVNYIQITSGTASRPLLREEWEKRCERSRLRECIPVLRSQRSALSDLLEGGGTVLTRTIEALDRVNRVLSEQNINAFTAVLSDTQAVTAELRERKALIADAQSALQRIDAAAAELAVLTRDARQMMDSDGRRTFKNVADAAEEARATAGEIRAMVKGLEGPTSDFAANGLPQATASLIQMQRAAEALERLVNELQSSPAGALGKRPAEDLKVKQ